MTNPSGVGAGLGANAEPLQNILRRTPSPIKATAADRAWVRRRDRPAPHPARSFADAVKGKSGRSSMWVLKVAASTSRE
jgi:hypothetical protein